jgi:arylsulfatase A-like enzyme
MYNLDDIDLPKEGNKDLDNRPWWHKASLESEPNLADPQLKFFRAKLSRSVDQTEKQLREMTANYFGMISLIDHNVGRILLELKRLSLDKNTIIVYSTDHGDLLGDHGLYLKGPTPYEGLLRVGLIVNGPGIPNNQIIKDPVSTLDIPATICDIAGANLPELAQSKSLMPVICNNASRDVAHSEWKVNASRCGVELELRTVRTKNAKLTVEKNTGAGEMYNLENDPYEMKNLFDDGNSNNLKKELMDMINERPGTENPNFDEPVGMA